MSLEISKDVYSCCVVAHVEISLFVLLVLEEIFSFTFDVSLTTINRK